MSYWQVDDSFLGHHKTVRALRHGAESIQMWMALRQYVATNNSDGVIPDEDIDDLPHAPKNPRRWLRVLVECGKPTADGERGPGLVDAHECGWKLHDYQDHGLSAAEITKRKNAARERKQRWKERRSGTEHERQTGTQPERVPNASRTATECFPIPSHPIPSQIDPEVELPPKDLTGVAREERPEQRSRLTEPAKVPCPADLKLTDKQRQSLITNMVEEWAIDVLTLQFVGKALCSPNDLRPRETWLKCLFTAVSRGWNDPNSRPKPPGATPDARFSPRETASETRIKRLDERAKTLKEQGQ